MRDKHYIYYNLHKKMFSCKNWSTKLVEFREKNLHIKNAIFKVSEKGRQRVIKEQRKNVHAGVLGNILYLGKCEIDLEEYIELTYNPYKFNSFVTKLNYNKVVSATDVILRDRKIYAKGVKYE